MNVLSTAYITQWNSENGKTDWIIFDSNKNELMRLPGRLTELEAMSILKDMRKFENKSFNEGIKYSEKNQPSRIKDLETIILNLKNENIVLLKENERIGEALDKAIMFNE